MGFLSGIRAAFGKKPTPPSGELSERTYALLPIKLVADGEPPFDLPEAYSAKIPEHYRDFWKGSIMQYQLFTFQAVNASTFGQDFALKILGIQVAWMNEADPGWGDNHAAGIARIYDGIQKHLNDPMKVKGESGETLEIPLEVRLASDILLTSPDSPFRIDPEFPVEPKDLFPKDENFTLAIDLERAKDASLEYFQRAASVVRFAPNR